MRRALALAVLGWTGACHRTASHADVAAPAVVERIVHGVVTVTGTRFEQQFVLESGSERLRLLASGADSVLLTGALGTEVSLHAVDEGNALRARGFTVTHVAGAPVVDGTLRRDGDRLSIVTTNGTFAIGNPPSAFWQLVGARVWVGGPLGTGPNSYNVIRR